MLRAVALGGCIAFDKRVVQALLNVLCIVPKGVHSGHHLHPQALQKHHPDCLIVIGAQMRTSEVTLALAFKLPFGCYHVHMPCCTRLEGEGTQAWAWTWAYLMQEGGDEGSDRAGLGRRQAELVGDREWRDVHAFAAGLHALEHHVQHLCERGLGGGLIHLRARHEENVVARAHRQQQRLSKPTSYQG